MSISELELDAWKFRILKLGKGLTGRESLRLIREVRELQEQLKAMTTGRSELMLNTLKPKLADCEKSLIAAEHREKVAMRALVLSIGTSCAGYPLTEKGIIHLKNVWLEQAGKELQP